jgi:hypothetical protein
VPGWWALWGVAGAFVAVPIVATLKIVADRVEALKPLGEFLGSEVRARPDGTIGRPNAQTFQHLGVRAF